MNRPTVTQAKMQRMRRAIEKEGLPFRGFRCYPDGSVDALVGEPLTGDPTPAPVPAGDGWEAYDQVHGHG